MSLILALFLATLPAPHTAAGSTPALRIDDKITQELARLYREDQDDQNHWESLGDEEFGRRQSVRRARVLEMLQKDQLSTPMDCHHASWLLQHGEGVDDFLMAHILASTGSFAGLEEAWFLSAAGLDRYFRYVDQLQRFGSQSTDAAGQALGDTSQLLNQVVVDVYLGRSTGLKGKPTDPAVRGKKELKAARSLLKKWAGKAEKTAEKAATHGKTAAEWADVLAQVRRILELGQLDGADDYYHAGVILSHADDLNSLINAHVMATAAGILQHRKARSLYEVTLDRMLLGLGRTPVFTDEVPEGRELVARAAILELPPKVRRLIAKGR